MKMIKSLSSTMITMFESLPPGIVTMFKIVLRIVSVFLFWITIHYMCSYLYIYLCVPNTFTGFVLSPFMTMSPHCQCLRWIIYNGGLIINAMWIMLGNWLLQKVDLFKL